MESSDQFDRIKHVSFLLDVGISDMNRLDWQQAKQRVKMEELFWYQLSSTRPDGKAGNASPRTRARTGSVDKDHNLAVAQCARIPISA